jgi:hypothetical protein
MRKLLESYGYDINTTPLDTLMAGPDQMHRDVAEDMEEDNDDA